MSADELRNITSNRLQNNSEYYLNFMPDYKLLKSNPNWFGGLWSGGAKAKLTRDINKLEEAVKNKDP